MPQNVDEYTMDDINNKLICKKCNYRFPEQSLTYCPNCKYPIKEILRSNNRPANFPIKKAALLAIICFSITTIFLNGVKNFHQQTIVGKYSNPYAVQFYSFQTQNSPKNNYSQLTKSIYTAIQSFKDHFNKEIKSFSFHEQVIPLEIAKLKLDLKNPKTHSLSFWQKEIFPKIKQTSIYHNEVTVLITNSPLYLDSKTIIKEARHLPSSKLISGISNKNFVLISTYRINQELKDLPSEIITKAIGEFVISHELGHSFFGINDIIVENSLRSPSSTNTCIMHSTIDENNLKNSKSLTRKTGEKSQCQEYHSILSAYEIAKKAMSKYLNDNKPEAKSLFEKSYNIIKHTQVTSEVKTQWKKDLEFLF